MKLSGFKLSLKGVQFSGFTKISLGVTGLLLVVWFVVTLLTSTETRSGPAAKSQPGQASCPNCGRPLSQKAVMAGECPYCKIDNPEKAKLVKPGDYSVFRSPWIPGLLIGFFCVVLTVNVAFFVRRLKLGTKPEDNFYHVNCHKCTRKVRYRQKQIGQFARCPICKQLMRFPEPPEQPKRRWAMIKGWLRPGKKKAQQDSA
jgi:Zn finger protein HypA/HybF involved in hydrogenase expression